MFTGVSTGGGGSSKDPVDKLVEPFEKAKEQIEEAITLLGHQYEALLRDKKYDKAAENLQLQINYYKQLQQAAHETAETVREYYHAQGMASDEIEEQTKILELRNEWMEASEKILELMDQQVEQLADTLSEVTDELEQFKNVYKTLVDAADQYHTDGFLQLDTLKSILDYGPQYLQFLQDENGALSYNEAALQKVIAAKTQEMAADTALVYLQKIETALTKQNTRELQQLTDITNLSADGVWGVVEARMAELKALGLSDAEYANVAENVARLRKLTDAATSAMDRYGASLHSVYMSQEDAVKKVFDLVKEYVKFENEQAVEAAVIAGFAKRLGDQVYDELSGLGYEFMSMS